MLTGTYKAAFRAVRDILNDASNLIAVDWELNQLVGLADAPVP